MRQLTMDLMLQLINTHKVLRKRNSGPEMFGGKERNGLEPKYNRGQWEQNRMGHRQVLKDSERREK